MYRIICPNIKSRDESRKLPRYSSVFKKNYEALRTNIFHVILMSLSDGTHWSVNPAKVKMITEET